MDMKKVAVLCSALASASVVSGEAFAVTLYRAPVSSNYAGINYWFDRNTGGGFLRYDGNTTAGYDGHFGIDFNMPSGGFWAGANGKVVQVVNNCPEHRIDPLCGNSYGNNVKLLHADGKFTAYGHMKQWSVKVVMDEYVLCSRLLGDIGDSGQAFGTHAHFDVRNGLGLASLYSYDPFGGYMYGLPTGWVYGWRSSGDSSWVSQNGLGAGKPGTTCQA